MTPHTLPKLPYAYDALEPYIDSQTMEIHHTKHHQTYINNLNLASPDQILRARSVESLVNHLKISESLNAVGLIFHIGSSKDTPPEDGLNHIVEGAKEVLKKVSGKSKLIL